MSVGRAGVSGVLMSLPVSLWVPRVWSRQSVVLWGSRGVCPYSFGWGELLFLGSGLCVVCPLQFVLHACVRWCFLSRGEQGLHGDDASHLWGWRCGLLLLLLPGGLFSLPCAKAVVFSVTESQREVMTSENVNPSGLPVWGGGPGSPGGRQRGAINGPS
jgi:hypothetical protein